MKRILLTLLAVVLPCCGHPAQGIEVGGPTHDGVEVQVDMPLSLRKKNIGGSDGSGLCVFTSIQNAARVQHVTTLENFQHFMSTRPGGGYPEKVDAMIAACAKQRGVIPPRYLQYEGTDPTPIRLACKAGRMPCITYDGRDKVHYSGHIEHMINCVYMDDKWACVLDNNFIGDDQLVWMTPAEFTSRWSGGQGRQGWMVLLLDPGAPPIPSSPVPPKGDEAMNALLLSAATLFAAPLDYPPPSRPVAGAAAWGVSGSCPNGLCPLSGPVGPTAPGSVAAPHYMLHRLDGSYVPCDANGVPLAAPEAKPPTKPAAGCHCTKCSPCNCAADGECGDAGDGPRIQPKPIKPRDLADVADADTDPVLNFGLEPAKMHKVEHWQLNGVELAPSVGMDALKAGQQSILAGPPDMPLDTAMPWLVGYGLNAPTEALLHTVKGVRAVNYPIGSAMALDRDGKTKWLAGGVCVLAAGGEVLGTVQAAEVADLVGRLNKLPDGWDPAKLPDLLHPRKPAPSPVDPVNPDAPVPVSPDAPADATLPIALAIGAGFLAITGGMAASTIRRKP